MAHSPISILHHNTIAGAILAKRKGAGGIDIESTAVRRHDEPDEEQDRYKDAENEDSAGDGLSACANDLIAAVKSNDPVGVASALKAAFELLESQPHEENNEEEQEQGEIE